MKSYQYLLLLLLPLLFTGCGKIKETKKNVKEAKKGLDTFNKMAKEVKNLEVDFENLAELEPLSNDDFKEWMPESIGALKRSGFKNNSLGAVNVASSEATYKSDDGNQQVKITVIDGAGSGSFAIAGIKLATAMDVEEQDEHGHRKTIKKNGIKAIENYKNRNNETELQFLHNERFSITVTANGMAPGDLWANVDDFNLRKLSKLAN